jgi:hypothetical protein
MDANIPKALLAGSSGVLAGITTCPHEHDPAFVATALICFLIGAWGTWFCYLTSPIHKD